MVEINDTNLSEAQASALFEKQMALALEQSKAVAGLPYMESIMQDAASAFNAVACRGGAIDDIAH